MQKNVDNNAFMKTNDISKFSIRRCDQADVRKYKHFFIDNFLFVYNFQVKICEAKGLPKDLSNFVFCQYSFWGHDDPISVPPEINPDTSKDKKDTKCIKFNHERVRSMKG